MDGMTDLQLAAVLWDMDGTLIDSEPLWLEAETQMLERYGLRMTPELAEGMIGTGLWDAAERFRALGVPMSADEIVAEWVAYTGRGIDAGGIDWRPGAREVLGSLREAGVPCALVTMAVRAIAERVSALLPAGTFGAIVAGDDVERAKPHPEAYLRGADALGVSIRSCLAFEDSGTGLRAASASGAVAIGVTNLVDLSRAPAHAIWPTLAGADADALRAAFRSLRSLDLPA